MKLGAPVLSPSRLGLRRLAMFASWENEAAIDAFLADTELGRELVAMLRPFVQEQIAAERRRTEADATPAPGNQVEPAGEHKP